MLDFQLYWNECCVSTSASLPKLFKMEKMFSCSTQTKVEFPNTQIEYKKNISSFKLMYRSRIRSNDNSILYVVWFKQNFVLTMRGQIIIFVFFTPTTFCVTSQFLESIQQYTCFKCSKLKQFFKLQSFMACIQFSAKLNFLNNFEHFAQRKSSNWNYVTNCRFKLYFQTNVVAYVEMCICLYWNIQGFVEREF